MHLPKRRPGPCYVLSQLLPGVTWGPVFQASARQGGQPRVSHSPGFLCCFGSCLTEAHLSPWSGAEGAVPRQDKRVSTHPGVCRDGGETPPACRSHVWLPGCTLAADGRVSLCKTQLCPLNKSPCPFSLLSPLAPSLACVSGPGRGCHHALCNRDQSTLLPGGSRPRAAERAWPAVPGS